MAPVTDTPAIHRTPCGVAVADSTFGVYLLTPCCGATGKGSVTGDTPTVVCRRCHRQVPDCYGGLFSRAESGRLRAAIIAAGQGRCPVPGDCADEVMWHLQREPSHHSGEEN